MASYVFVRLSRRCGCFLALACGFAPGFTAAASIVAQTGSGALLQVGLNVSPTPTRPLSAFQPNASVSHLGSTAATHPNPWALHAIGQSYKDQRFVDLGSALFGGALHDLDENGKQVEVVSAWPSATDSATDIWSSKKEWGTVVNWHPAGVVSNINNGRVQWTSATYVSLNMILLLTMVAYPALLIAFVMLLTLLVSLCMTVEEGDNENPRRDGCTNPTVANYDISSPTVPIPQLSVEELSPSSRILYKAWRVFCCSIPALTVFGLPVVVACFSYPRPQEVFSVLTVLTTACMYSTGVYIIIFGTSAMLKIRSGGPNLLDGGRGGIGDAHPTYRPSSDVEDAPETATEVLVEDVIHYVIMPQFEEDVENVSMALESIASGPFATTSICVVLAMEEREEAARAKAQTLQNRFEAQFSEILVTYHPSGLPNDPPGKASNTAWAFKELLAHLDRQDGRIGRRMVLTIADADSHFHERYFEELGRRYLGAGEKCDLTLWQSPIFHIKNYHRQPSAVVVGTVFTAVFEMACMADPNAVRFPYSSYSLSLELARRVGGWDPQWIAEDWHMGIKCFLLTFGRAAVRPIMLPTINYTPEEDTWLGTIHARWVQAQRHALGFSDLSYYFMTLPLIFGYAVSEATKKGKSHISRDLLGLVYSGLSIVVKIMNVHVLLGVVSTYGFFTFVLGVLMQMYFDPNRLLAYFLDQNKYVPCFLFAGTSVCTTAMTVLWMVLYNFLKKDIEAPKDDQRWLFNNCFVHWLYVVMSFQVYGLFYFTALAFATWKAAWGMLTLSTFEYEVASKPTTSSRLGS
jgi:hypothetical protein